MAWVVPAMQIAGTVLGVMGAAKQGKDDKAAADFQAAQLDQSAGQSRASGQREALEQKRQARLANSRLRALAQGGGGDPTIVKLSQDIAGEGEFRALTALYEGEERARGMEMSATGARKSGKSAQQVGYVRGFSTVLDRAPGLYEKYGRSGSSGQL
jgi:hypothetical protein